MFGYKEKAYHLGSLEPRDPQYVRTVYLPRDRSTTNHACPMSSVLIHPFWACALATSLGLKRARRLSPSQWRKTGPNQANLSRQMCFPAPCFPFPQQRRVSSNVRPTTSSGATALVSQPHTLLLIPLSFLHLHVYHSLTASCFDIPDHPLPCAQYIEYDALRIAPCHRRFFSAPSSTLSIAHRSSSTRWLDS